MASQSDHRYIALKVGCVATGFRHDARAVCSVVVVDYDENALLQAIVKPKSPVVSYLTPLTGVKEGDLDSGQDIEDVICQVKALLGPDVILVGQMVQNQVQWLCLEEGKDYCDVVELSEMFKTYNPRYRNYTRYPLRHEANVLLSPGFLSEGCSPVKEAIASIKLCKRFNGKSVLLEGANSKLRQIPMQPSFGKTNNYLYEGVCLKSSKCNCGAPDKWLN